MRYGKLIKVGIVLAGVLTNTFVLAAQDPVSVKLTSALTSPIVVGTATPTTYTLTNNLPFALTPTFTTNSAAYVVSSSTCNNVASKKQCQVIATYTPSSVSTPAPMLTVTYDTTRFSLTQTPTIVTTPTPDSLTLTATPSALNFTAPNVAQSMTFQTTPATANVVISVSNLPSGVSSASSCTTASTGSCSVTFTANSSAYGSKAMTLSASAVKTPPTPTISVANTTVTIADSTYLAPTGADSVTLSNTGVFAWQTGVANAVQVTGSNVTEFGVNVTNCTANNVAPGSTCNINFSPTTGANAGDGVNIAVGSNATQSGNGDVYISSGVTATLSGQTSDTFTDIDQKQTLTLKNTSSAKSATIDTVAFTNGTSNINNIKVSNDCSSALAVGASCTVVYTSQASSYGSDTITVNYTLNGKAQSSVESSHIVVRPTTLTITHTGGTAISSSNFIPLLAQSDTGWTNEQTFTISGAPFNWQNPSVTLSNGPTNDTSSIFYSSSCDTNACTLKFNTNVTNEGNKIAALNFSDSRVNLTASGNNIGSTKSTWYVPPVVGQFMQGGVVYWVGPNTGATTGPGYRAAMVAAVKDMTGTYKWDGGTAGLRNALAAGFFTGPGTPATATGLANTNAICSNSPPYTATCNSTSYPAAAAAQSYTGGSHTDWFLPAGSPVSDQGYGYCNSTAGTPTITAAGELCELYNQRAIINATATTHAGSNFVTTCTTGLYDCVYWSSSEYAQLTNFAWFVNFDDGYQGTTKDDLLSVRPVRAFNY